MRQPLRSHRFLFVNYVKSQYIFSQRSQVSRCCVRAEGGYNDWFHVLTGNHKGCLLSPLLFAVTIGWVLKLTTRDNQDIERAEDHYLSDLDFAQDIAAFYDSTEGLQHLTELVSNAAEGLRLVVINAKKTKNMLTGDHQPRCFQKQWRL